MMESEDEDLFGNKFRKRILQTKKSSAFCCTPFTRQETDAEKEEQMPALSIPLEFVFPSFSTSGKASEPQQPIQNFEDFPWSVPRSREFGHFAWGLPCLRGTPAQNVGTFCKAARGLVPQNPI